jgi:hypothetical protein
MCGGGRARRERDNFFNRDSAADFHDRFVRDEWGSNAWKLTADGCAKRYDPYNVFRDNELVSENMSTRREFGNRWNPAEFSEKDTQNALAILSSKGFTDLKPEETTEEFIQRHIEVLGGIGWR